MLLHCFRYFPLSLSIRSVTGDRLVHVSHVGDRSASFSIAVEVADSGVEVGCGHRTKRLLVDQLHRAVAVSHGDVLEQSLGTGRVRLVGRGSRHGVRDRKLRNGNGRGQAAVKDG